MAIDLNADVGTIIKGLMGNKKANAEPTAEQVPAVPKTMPKLLQEPYSFIVYASIGIVLFVLAFVFGLYIPKIESNEQKQQEIVRLEGLQTEITNMEAQIKGLNNALSKSRQHYKKLLAKFSNSEDLGELYQSISALALTYNLVVVNLKEIAKKPKPKIAPPPAGKKKAKKKKKSVIADVNGIQVDVVLKGWYGNYIKFRDELSKNEELLSINSESIKVGDIKKDQGKITVSMKLSTYAIDKNPFFKAIGDES